MTRIRDEQEMRNGVEVMRWIEHLTSHSEVTIDLNLICHVNKVILQGTERDYWAGRLRAEADWQEPEEWGRRRFLFLSDLAGKGRQMSVSEGWTIPTQSKLTGQKA